MGWDAACLGQTCGPVLMKQCQLRLSFLFHKMGVITSYLISLLLCSDQTHSLLIHPINKLHLHGDTPASSSAKSWSQNKGRCRIWALGIWDVGHFHCWARYRPKPHLLLRDGSFSKRVKRKGFELGISESAVLSGSWMTSSTDKHLPGHLQGT